MSTDDGVRPTGNAESPERAAERLGWAFESETTGGTDGRADRLEQLLFHSAGDGLQKPYLGGLPSGYAAENLIFDWLEFLVERAGYRRAVEALRYYRRIDWLTEPVERELGEYLLGFPETTGTGESLTVDDHQRSLVFVAKLSSLD